LGLRAVRGVVLVLLMKQAVDKPAGAEPVWERGWVFPPLLGLEVKNE